MAQKIACIAWGSLVWDARSLPVSGEWMKDGPSLPIEFARESADGRITLVLCEGVKLVPACWAMLNVDDVANAICALAEREGITRRIAHDIGQWDLVGGKMYGMYATAIAAWARGKALDGVVWTNLPCGFRERRGCMPTQSEIVNHLASLSSDALERAMEYVKMTPRQIDTTYRKAITIQLRSMIDGNV